MVDYDGRLLMNYDFVQQALTPVSLTLEYDALLYDPNTGLRTAVFLTSDAPARVQGLHWRWLARDRRGQVFAQDQGTVAEIAAAGGQAVGEHELETAEENGLRSAFRGDATLRQLRQAPGRADPCLRRGRLDRTAGRTAEDEVARS